MHQWKLPVLRPVTSGHMFLLFLYAIKGTQVHFQLAQASVLQSIVTLIKNDNI